MPKRKPIDDLLAVYGKQPGHTCGECKHLVTWRFASDYFKCELSRSRGQSGGPSTDWRKSWPACGRFEPGEGPVRYGAH